jgi:ketosteroid isomerase-like protein
MSDQENLEIVQEWIAAINDHDADRLAATLDEDFVWEL